MLHQQNYQKVQDTMFFDILYEYVVIRVIAYYKVFFF